MSCTGQMLLIFGAHGLFNFFFLFRKQYKLLNRTGQRSDITLGLDSLGIIKMEVDFYSWMSLDRSPYLLSRPFITHPFFLLFSPFKTVNMFILLHFEPTIDVSSFIHSLSEHLLSPCFVPGTVLHVSKI